MDFNFFILKDYFFFFSGVFSFSDFSVLEKISWRWIAKRSTTLKGEVIITSWWKTRLTLVIKSKISPNIVWSVSNSDRRIFIYPILKETMQITEIKGKDTYTLTWVIVSKKPFLSWLNVSTRKIPLSWTIVRIARKTLDKTETLKEILPKRVSRTEITTSLTRSLKETERVVSLISFSLSLISRTCAEEGKFSRFLS